MFIHKCPNVVKWDLSRSLPSAGRAMIILPSSVHPKILEIIDDRTPHVAWSTKGSRRITESPFPREICLPPNPQTWWCHFCLRGKTKFQDLLNCLLVKFWGDTKKQIREWSNGRPPTGHKLKWKVGHMIAGRFCFVRRTGISYFIYL